MRRRAKLMEGKHRKHCDRVLSRAERVRAQLRAAAGAGHEKIVSDAVNSFEAYKTLYADDRKLALDRKRELRLLDEIERLHMALDSALTAAQLDLSHDRWKQELATAHAIEQIRLLLQRLQEKRLLCDHLLRRVELVQQQLLDNEAHTEATEAEITTALEELLVYLTPYAESKKTPLDRIARDQQVADAIEHVHSTLDDVLVKTNRYNAVQTKRWVDELQSLRRAEQYELVQQLDAMVLTEAHREVIDALKATFKHELLKNRQNRTAIDLEFMAKVYFRLYRSSRSLQSNVPAWFIPRGDLTINYDEVIDTWQSVRILHGSWGRGTSVAIVLMTLSDPRERNEMVKVVEVWFKLNHPHVLKLFGACDVGDPLLFACEHIMDGSVGQYLAKPANKDKFWRVIYEASLALFYMHSQRTVHGCIQGRQLRMGADGKTKLCNFSSSFLLHRLSAPLSPRERSNEVRWMAPERLTGGDEGNPSYASDVYALGMCIIELASSEVPWGANATDTDILTVVVEDRKMPDRPSQLDDAAWKLVLQMCAFEPTERPKMAAVTDTLGEFVRKETAAKPLPKKFCTNCGTQLDLTAKFCAQCGTRQTS